MVLPAQLPEVLALGRPPFQTLRMGQVYFPIFRGENLLLMQNLVALAHRHRPMRYTVALVVNRQRSFTRSYHLMRHSTKSMVGPGATRHLNSSPTQASARPCKMDIRQVCHRVSEGRWPRSAPCKHLPWNSLSCLQTEHLTDLLATLCCKTRRRGRRDSMR